MAENEQPPANRLCKIRRALKLANPELSSAQLDAESQILMRPDGWVNWLLRHPILGKQRRALLRNAKYANFIRIVHKGPDAKILNRAQMVIEASKSTHSTACAPIFHCYGSYGITEQTGKSTMKIGIKARIEQKLKGRRNALPRGKTFNSCLSDYGIANSGSDSESEDSGPERANSEESDTSIRENVISISDEDDDDDDDDGACGVEDDPDSSSDSTSSNSTDKDTPTTPTSPDQPAISTPTPTNTSRNEQLLHLVRLITTNGDQFNELRMEQLLKIAGQSDVSIDD